MPKTVKTANGKKTRKKKDPSKPKGKRSAFVFFSSAVHAQVKAENPGFGFGEVVREIARQWKLVKDTPAAAPYRKKAEEDAVRYDSEKATWKPAPTKAEADHDDELSNETVSGGEAKTPAAAGASAAPAKKTTQKKPSAASKKKIRNVIMTVAKNKQTYEHAKKISSELYQSSGRTVNLGKGIAYKIWDGVSCDTLEEVDDQYYMGDEENGYESSGDRFAGRKNISGDFAGFVVNKVSREMIGKSIEPDREEQCSMPGCKGKMFGPDCNMGGASHQVIDKLRITELFDELGGSDLELVNCSANSGSWNVCSKGHIWGHLDVELSMCGYHGWVEEGAY